MVGLSPKRRPRKEKQENKRAGTSDEKKDLEELHKRLQFLECLVLDLKSEVDGLRKEMCTLKSTNIAVKLDIEKINQKQVRVERDKEFESSLLLLEKDGVVESNNQITRTFPTECLIKSNVDPSSEQQISRNPKMNAQTTKSKAYEYLTRGKSLRSSTVVKSRLELQNKIKTSKSSKNCDRTKTHRCQICDKIFTCAPNLARHIQLHIGERPFKCELCSTAFFRKADLELHVRRHLGEKAHQCKLCKWQFVTRQGLTRHCITKHSSGVKPYQCIFCSKRQISRYALHAHLRTHIREKPFECPTCSREYKVKRGLSDHMIRNKH